MSNETTSARRVDQLAAMTALEVATLAVKRRLVTAAELDLAFDQLRRRRPDGLVRQLERLLELTAMDPASVRGAGPIELCVRVRRAVQRLVNSGTLRQPTEIEGQQHLPGFEAPMVDHGRPVPEPPSSMRDRATGTNPSREGRSLTVHATPAQIVTTAVIEALDALERLDAVLSTMPPLTLDEHERFGHEVERLLRHPARDLETRLVEWWISPGMRSSRSMISVPWEDVDDADQAAG